MDYDSEEFFNMCEELATIIDEYALDDDKIEIINNEQIGTLCVMYALGFARSDNDSINSFMETEDLTDTNVIETVYEKVAEYLWRMG